VPDYFDELLGPNDAQEEALKLLALPGEENV
jgi:hypothetical protein